MEVHSDKPEEDSKEVDFFEEHSTATDGFEDSIERLSLNDNNSLIKSSNNVTTSNLSASLLKDDFNGDGPTVNLSSAHTAPEPERKSLIGGRKPQAKKPGVSYFRDRCTNGSFSLSLYN